MTRDPRIEIGPRAALPLADEVPVALVYNGETQAVMMATPRDLEDFARGFSLTEGIVTAADEIEEIEIVDHGRGFEARMWLPEAAAGRLAARRRAMTGPVGCGLCGIDSIEAALRPAAQVATGSLRLSARDLRAAPEALRRRQPGHDATHAMHAAALWEPGRGLLFPREDVGRHNALDKVAGACLAAGETGRGRAVVLTSRVSVEMVQKAAAMGAEAVVAVSAPTALAVEMAEAAGLTLLAGLKHTARVYAHPHRLTEGAIE
ncbi:formate dehydrogenase accessory sulfurtransferase FdhD [Rhodosalinus sp. FB01]|uniref:formate dehydrogenase accessory sulfurtransferase FdhD n=1 Tax=Rhodosalinus sp. FB01 TaxID=3239194 RepID=UPI0035242362